MKTKLHFGILIVLLAFFGRCLEQSTNANQQIVIQFSDNDISKKDAQSTIDGIHKKLQSVGAEHIQIGHSENGQLTIIYYSNSDVAHIQDVLSNQEAFQIAYNSNDSQDYPKEKRTKNYELNISEIQKSNPTNWDFEGIQTVELKQKTDRFNNLKVNTSGQNLDSKYLNRSFQVAINVSSSVVIATDTISYRIPEVRAGPTA